MYQVLQQIRTFFWIIGRKMVLNKRTEICKIRILAYFWIMVLCVTYHISSVFIVYLDTMELLIHRDENIYENHLATPVLIALTHEVVQDGLLYKKLLWYICTSDRDLLRGNNTILLEFISSWLAWILESRHFHCPSLNTVKPKTLCISMYQYLYSTDPLR